MSKELESPPEGKAPFELIPHVPEKFPENLKPFSRKHRKWNLRKASTNRKILKRIRDPSYCADGAQRGLFRLATPTIANLAKSNKPEKRSVLFALLSEHGKIHALVQSLKTRTETKHTMEPKLLRI